MTADGSGISLPGAYGFRYLGDLPAAGLNTCGPEATWPSIHLRYEVSAAAPAPADLAEDAASLALAGGGTVLLDRRLHRATYRTPAPLTRDERVHPGLGPVASVFGWWQGDEVFHGGAVAGPEGAWGLLGDRGAGKSTTLAWLSLTAGLPVLSDDLAVLRERGVMAGPRTLDLRQTTAERLTLHEGVQPVRNGQRIRLPLAPVPLEAPLRGWLVLSPAPPGTPPRVERVDLADRFSVLAVHRALRGPAIQAVRYLDAAAVPMWRVIRPLEWSSLDATGRLITELITQP